MDIASRLPISAISPVEYISIGPATGNAIHEQVTKRASILKPVLAEFAKVKDAIA